MLMEIGILRFSDVCQLYYSSTSRFSSLGYMKRLSILVSYEQIKPIIKKFPEFHT